VATEVEVFWEGCIGSLNPCSGAPVRLWEKRHYVLEITLTDIAENKSPDVSARDIVSRHVTASTQNLAQKLGGGGQKRKRKAAPGSIRKNKKAKLTKLDIFS
jgi:hypothetical protein